MPIKERGRLARISYPPPAYPRAIQTNPFIIAVNLPSKYKRYRAYQGD